MKRPFYIISNRREAFVNILEQIDSAESSIKICTYFWLDGEISDIILQRLWVAACRGIQVDIIIDGKAALVTQPKKLLSLCNMANIYKYRGKNFLHSKMWLFDNKNLIVTSANISDRNYTTKSDFLNMTNSDTYLPDISLSLVNRVNSAFEYYKIKSKFVKPTEYTDRYVPKSIHDYESLKRIYRRPIALEYTRAHFFYNKLDIEKNIRIALRAKDPQILCGYVNSRILSKLSADSNYKVHTSSLKALNFVDRVYWLLNGTYRIPLEKRELYVGKIHTKTYLTDDYYITGSYNLDYFSKYNEEILLKLDY